MKSKRNRIKEWCRSLGITLLAVLIVAGVFATGLYRISDPPAGKVLALKPDARPGQDSAKTVDDSSGKHARGLASEVIPKSGDSAPAQAAGTTTQRQNSKDSTGRGKDAPPDGANLKFADRGVLVPTESMTKVETPPLPPAGIGEQASTQDPGHSASGGVKKAIGAGGKAAAAERRKSEERWRKTLDDLHLRGLHARRGAEAAKRRAEAEAKLESITDPAAVPAIWRVFAGKNEHHLLLAQMLGRIESAESSKMLAQLSVFSDDGKARQAATKALLTRDPGDFAENLIGLLNSQMKYRSESFDIPGQGRAQVLFIEGERADYRFVYPTAERPEAPRGPKGVYSLDNPYMTRHDRESAEAFNRQQAEMARMSVEDQIKSDIAEITRGNGVIVEVNARTVGVLREVSGKGYGPNREAWRRWLADRQGYPYEPPKTVLKPTTEQIVPHWYQPSFIGIPIPT